MEYLWLEQPHGTFLGIISGCLWASTYGNGGFGYDPYGYPYGYNLTGTILTGITVGYNFTVEQWLGEFWKRNNNTPTRPGINYGGARPSKYGRSGGGSAIMDALL